MIKPIPAKGVSGLFWKRALAIGLALALPCAGALADTAVNGRQTAALIATDGTEIIPAGTYVRIEPLKTGFWCGVEQTGGCALLDAAGQPLSDERFDELRCTSGALLFRRGEVWGLLSDDGSVLVEPRYSDIRANGEGDFVALRKSVGTGSAQTVDYLSADGQETAIGVRVLYGLNDFSEGYMPVLFARSGRYGYLDTQGVVAFGGDYIAAGPFQDGYAVVATEEGTGMINQVGRMVVPAEFADILRVGDLALLTKKDGGVLVVRIGGEILMDLSGEAYAGEVGGMGLIHQESAMTVIGADGQTAFSLDANATVAGGLSGRLIVSEGLWGEAGTYLADADGAAVSGRYQTILPLSAGGESDRYAVGRFDAEPVRDESGATLYYRWEAGELRYALMDGAGQLLSDFIYTFLRPAEEGLFYAATEEQCGVIDAEGNFLWVAPADFA